LPAKLVVAKERGGWMSLLGLEWMVIRSYSVNLAFGRTRLQAALAGNQEMILFYWGIDREEDKRRMRPNLPEKSR
jgi:hypothetical protein